MKLGKLSPQIPERLGSIWDYHPLPNAPSTYLLRTPIEWGMLGNDTLGDCTMAGAAHLLMRWNLLGTPKPVPDTQQVETEYYALTGGADTGLVELDVLKTWQQQGMWGTKVMGFAPTAQRHLRETMLLFGGAYLGIQLPESAETQFAAGEQWTVTDSAIAGGHCIVAVGYTPHYVQIVSWGKLTTCTWEFLAHYMDESWAIVPPEFALSQQDKLSHELALI